MALETKLYQKLTQQLVMTPQLRQAIKILQVSRAELETLIGQELEQNPVLEASQETEETAERVSTAEEPRVDGVVAENEPASANGDAAENERADKLDDIDWREFFETYNSDFHGAAANTRESDDDQRPALENVLTKTPDLGDDLLEQLRVSHLSHDEILIGEILIGNVDSNGYLKVPVEELAAQAGVRLEEVEQVLRKLQDFDPPGVFARDLRECLLIQLRRNGDRKTLAYRIVRDHMTSLESRRFEKLARDLDVPLEDVVDAAKRIATLEPKPGRNYGDGDNRYVIPDIYVHKVGEDWVITLNDDGMPRLRVSRYYQRVLSGSSDSDADARGYIQERMRAARWVIESIERRRRTIRLVMESILKFQRKFFEHGISGLRPLVLRDVANDIGMHESTVSRATSNKYVHTPHGVFELKRFFTTGLGSYGGEDVSAERVKQRVREIIADEDPKKPYSDQVIAKMLSRESVDIARRTVAKYREMMGILPSSKRKQL